MFIRVLLADDSRIMRDAIRCFLNGYSEIALIGEAADFLQTIRMVCDSKAANPSVGFAHAELCWPRFNGCY